MSGWKARSISSTNQKFNQNNRDLLAHFFPRLVPLRVFASSLDWFIALFGSVVIGQRDCFGLGLTVPN